MKHFVIYHSAEKMGYSAHAGARENLPFSILTDKTFDQIEGSRIWLVMGEGAPRRYSLVYWFTADAVESGDFQGYRYCVTGAHGQRFTPGIPLNNQPWFPGFRRAQGNFAFGFSPITQQQFIEALHSLAGGPGARAPHPFDYEVPDRVESTIQRIIRDTTLSKQIKQAHDWMCQLCSTVIELPGGGRYAEAHHLRPLGTPHCGPDLAGNLICVCPNCHAKLDFGVIALKRSDIQAVTGHTVSQEFIDYHNNEICNNETELRSFDNTQYSRR